MAREHLSADANEERPSVALTARFLALCQQYGSEQLAVSIVAAGRSAGVPGLPQSNDWTAWNAGEMRAANRASAAQARYPGATSITWGTDRPDLASAGR